MESILWTFEQQKLVRCDGFLFSKILKALDIILPRKILFRMIKQDGLRVVMRPIVSQGNRIRIIEN